MNLIQKQTLLAMELEGQTIKWIRSAFLWLQAMQRRAVVNAEKVKFKDYRAPVCVRSVPQMHFFIFWIPILDLALNFIDNM